MCVIANLYFVQCSYSADYLDCFAVTKAYNMTCGVILSSYVVELYSYVCNCEFWCCSMIRYNSLDYSQLFCSEEGLQHDLLSLNMWC